ncbi:MAG: hypothetical protein KBS58_02585 [Bacteroidales bacterium]|nr:hypothetical protein [Candidatus Cacconaster equi]
MINASTPVGFAPLAAEDTAYIIGGVDKNAQDALYTIGYILGVVVKFLVALFTFDLKKKA